MTFCAASAIESALMMGRDVLCQLGFGAYRARQAAMKFRALNIANLNKVYPYYKDREQYVSMARRAREELHAMFERDFVAMKDGQEEREDRDN